MPIRGRRLDNFVTRETEKGLIYYLIITLLYYLIYESEVSYLNSRVSTLERLYLIKYCI